MADPSYALQYAVVAALKASTSLKNLISDPVRVYDRVPVGATYPYLTISGDEQVLDAGNSCGDAWEVFQNVHVWDDAIGMTRAKQIAGAVRDALIGAISITGFQVIEALHQNTRYIKDPDPLLEHAVVTVRYLIDPT